MRLTSIGYEKELPERFTRERYIRIYRKIFATLRHDLYVKIMEFKRSAPGLVSLPEDKFEQLWGEVWGTFEKVRTEIYNLMM